ncbi:MAG: aromatic amino acid lyase [Firmicutes bacterium]|nr:aromatic amino acid lyase [Bacillota bacterium]MBR3374468.1 aromatic amino acid lyase [Bacillota bacterium]MBR6956438.1 aromatic amino acid lyase [Bacillota bacterium]
MDKLQTKTIVLGGTMDLDTFMSVVRGGATVEFSDEYVQRVNKARKLVEKWTEEDRVMYGVTTGFGSLCTKVISNEDAAKLQHNIIASHSTSVGKPLSAEAVRAIMLMVLQNLGRGNSGVRIEVLERYRDFLNMNITPWAPGDGSVGYLSPEAHMARVIEGNGKAYYQGTLQDASWVLAKTDIKPLPLASKEGLALISGTTSTTGLAAIAIYDMINAVKNADIIGALTLENLKGVMRAFDERVMKVRPHSEQAETAYTVRRILEDSEVIKACQGERIQDALSLRCIPQLHGAAKKTLYDAKKTIEIEMNSCCDNPVIWPEEGDEDVISACNADSSYVGIEMDSAAIAATTVAKMSERRNNRLVDESYSGYPSFMVANPGLNSGLMIPQYTQAGLLNEMRILSSPATVDNTPTCVNQEDYVSMGYNAAKKALSISEKLEYILAIELLSDYQALNFTEDWPKRSSVSNAIYGDIGRSLPLMKEDMFLYEHIEFLRSLIHSGLLVKDTESIIGEMK